MSRTLSTGVGGVHGKGHAVQEAYMAGSVHGRGVVNGRVCVCDRGACMAGGMHGRGVCMAGGHVWQGCAWWGHIHGRGMHGRGGHVLQERRPLQHTVCILLECILVFKCK